MDLAKKIHMFDAFEVVDPNFMNIFKKKDILQECHNKLFETCLEAK